MIAGVSAVLGGLIGAIKLGLPEISIPAFISYDFLGIHPVLITELENAENIKILENIKPVEILGDEGRSVNGFKFECRGIERTISVNAVFVEVGVIPSSALVAGINVELNGQFIKVGPSQETSIPGIYAAGDITGGIARQAIISAGDGAKADVSSIDYIKKLGVSASKLKTTRWGISKTKTISKEITDAIKKIKGELFDYIQADTGFAAGYKRYKPQIDQINSIKAILPKARLIIISAHWCSDCRRNVPKMAKIAENLPEWEFHVESRDAEGVPEKYNIRKIPTFIVQRNEEEINRIIEHPRLGSLEEDLLAIVKGKYA